MSETNATPTLVADARCHTQQIEELGAVLVYGLVFYCTDRPEQVYRLDNVCAAQCDIQNLCTLLTGSDLHPDDVYDVVCDFVAEL